MMTTLAWVLTALLSTLGLLSLTALPVVAAPVTTSSAAKSCTVNFNGAEIAAPRGGGASIQTYAVNADCSITTGHITQLLKGTPEFDAFRAAHGSRASGSVDPGCNSELDYDDHIGIILTYTWMDMNYGYNYSAGQVTSVGPYYRQASAASDGWYIISTSFSPWNGPIPYGTVTSSYNGTFAWVLGSFWHSGTNHNRANGFGVCDGWPSESGSVVPGGYWAWAVWQT